MTNQLQNTLKNLPKEPGVYQMLDQHQQVIYVGKAKNLKNRVSSYFRDQVDNVKTAAMVRHVADIKLIVTRNENEALLLESNLIKEIRPKYNILFKDDKSFPYLIFSDHAYPRLDYIRSHKTPKGHYFGPYPNAYAAKEALHLLQKLFLIRNCRDGFFRNRSRPCLQYHIKRCSAPCVGYIDEKAYRQDIEYAKLFLHGKKHVIIEKLTQRMDVAAQALDYETAAFYRDQIQLLHRLETEQAISKGHQDYDVIAVSQQENIIILELLQIRQGKLIGDQYFSPQHTVDQSIGEIIESFIEQHYLNSTKTIPRKILVHEAFDNASWLASVLSEQSNKTIRIHTSKNDYERKLIQMALANATQNLQMQITHQSSMQKRFEELCQALNLSPRQEWRIECFDISHTFGEATVASCVVFDENGPRKSDYRLFNIQNITAGDDFAAMHQALQRRYAKVQEGLYAKPDILLIDGGKGQISQAMDVLKTLEIEDILVLGIAKGPSRKAGLETIFIGGTNRMVDLSEFQSAMHLLQHVRDEAHRFAITKHRAKRGKTRRESSLENIPGIGSKKRQALLKYFGGLQELQNASLEQISHAPGIGPKLAEVIYQHLHN